ncbi:MAG: three-Cys-motif partner protein TcmP [Myxococcales bacterium]|nr:three-Cys-motif partner protein TcmP [Myxococcales bacterium]MCB9630220.1 three-Cys-motif partner protein TcmP [Sandaracinaceae bacterium]
MDDLYDGREQSAAKHQILRTYLQRLAFKVGQAFGEGVTINYVDAFAGPWGARSESLEDSSPGIALATLLGVRRELAKMGKQIAVRAFFVSRSDDGVQQLRRLEKLFPDVTVEIHKGTFEEALPAVHAFVACGARPFSFLFLDPTGWTGFPLKTIAPLLRSESNEVLINFMLGHIRRFADPEGATHSESIEALYGDRTCRDEWAGLDGSERDEQIVAAYCRRITQAGSYSYCVSAPIFKPTEDREVFRLIYGTRNLVGLTTFREAEARGLAAQKVRRAGAKQRKRETKHSTRELFSPQEMEPSRTHEDDVRAGHLRRARAHLDELVVRQHITDWDELVAAALQFPLVCEADVKEWLKEQQHAGVLEVLGLAGRESVPKVHRGHTVRRVR